MKYDPRKAIEKSLQKKKNEESGETKEVESDEDENNNYKKVNRKSVKER